MSSNNHHADALSTPASPAVLDDRDPLRPGKGKDPNEVLGTPTQSGLGVAIAQATIFTILVMACFTYLPYRLGKQVSAAPVAPATPNAAPSTPEQGDAARVETP